MPYALQKTGSGYVVVNQATGRKHSNRPLPRKRAVAQMRALYAAENKDAGTTAGAMAHGPGGLLGVAGRGRRGRKWGNRRKSPDCTCGVATKEQLSPGVTRIRGNLCNVHGRYGPCDAGASAARKPKGKKGRKPKAAAKPKKPIKTTEQRLADRQQAQAENRSKVLSGLGIGADGQKALEALRSGQQPDASAILSGGFEQAGLVERAADGSYRLTASGRAAMAAANAGDRGRAGDIISGARDRLGARQGRQTAAEQRRQDVAARRAAAEAERQQRRQEAKKRSSGAKRTGDRGREEPATERAPERAPRPTAPAPKPAQQTTRQQPAQRATAPAERVSGKRPSVITPSRKRGRMQRSNIGTRTKAADPGDYLIVEDRTKPSTWHLPVKKNGTPDHRLMGAAWAALHGGYRGNTYDGPNKQEAISKLKRLYEREGMPMPSEKTKAQSAQDRAMFAKMGGGGSGGGKGGSGGSSLFPRNEDGERVPTSAYISKMRDQAASLYKQRSRNDDRIVSLRKGKQTPETEREIARLRKENSDLDKQYRRVDKKRRAAEANAHNRAPKEDKPFASDEKSFTVFKSDDGNYRWIARTTTAYRDRDGEIITTKALEDDAARMTATGQYGPLRYWHLGMPDPFDPAAPWGLGVDIGDCDYSTVIGRTSIESGTFKSAAIGAAFAQAADDYELSPGFFHPVNQPTQAGEYSEIRRFERSVVPVKYGRASNLFTGMTVKEHAMDQSVYEQRVKAFLADMQAKGVPPEAAASALAGMDQADKSAQQRGIAFKAETAPAEIEINGQTYTLKAPVIEIEDDTEETDEGPGYLGDMAPEEYMAAMKELLGPALKMGEMLKAMEGHIGELKGLMGGATTKSAIDLSEITALKAAIADATKRLAALEGDQPAIVSADVEAALKGGPQSPPSPDAPIVPRMDPDRPFAGWTAALFPELYTAQS